jgi:hypothetical protein
MDECWANTGDTCGWSRTTLLQLNQCFSFTPATLALNANNGRYNEDSVKYRAQVRASLSPRISSCHKIRLVVDAAVVPYYDRGRSCSMRLVPFTAASAGISRSYGRLPAFPR